jgi:hypothetical protein
MPFNLILFIVIETYVCNARFRVYSINTMPQATSGNRPFWCKNIYNFSFNKPLEENVFKIRKKVKG